MKFAVATLLALVLAPTPALAPSVGPSVGTDEPVEVDFATLSAFDYEEGMELPESVTKFDQKKVKISGFMATEDDTEGEVEYFILINDACGCQGTPKLNEMIFCAMPEDETTTISPGTTEIVGTLYVGEEQEDDVVVALYTMDVESVK